MSAPSRFSNYIAHSVIARVMFNQLGLFGTVPRWQHPLIVLAIWMLQRLYLPHWLARFRYDPLEWMWPHGSPFSNHRPRSAGSP